MLKAFFFVVVFLLGVVIGGGVVLFYYPFWFPPAQVNEQVQDIESKQKVLAGTFIHPDPSDSIHWGKGRVELYQSVAGTEVFLTEDFQVGPGPDFHVYLVDRRDITEEDHFTSAIVVELGRLKSFEGSQVYAATGIELDSQAGSVVVWCKRFSQLITSANLER